ncbi:MAG: metallophosphoesterase family protein, partial [bacterium]
MTKLYRPILNIPQIVTPGMEFRILFKPTVTPRNFWGRITSSIGISIPLIIVDWFEEGEYWLIRAVVPYGTPYDIYRLFVASDAESDSSLNAIRVIPQYLDNFYFVHITDTHLPNQLDPEHPYRYLDSNTLEEFNEILYEIQFINPEFVIHTGDLIDNYTIESQYQIAQDILSTSKVPIFVTAGNHDLNDFMIPYVQPGRVKWERYFGRIMNYTFVYGRIFFIGLEAYDTPSISFTDDQLNYLRTELTSSFERGDPCRVVFYHGDMRRLDLGLPQITDAFVDSYHIDMTLYGHTHIDSVYFLGSRGIPDINTSS